jgi:hypothetical protein
MNGYMAGDIVEIVHADGRSASGENGNFADDGIACEFITSRSRGRRTIEATPVVRVGSRAMVAAETKDGRVVLALVAGWAAIPVANVRMVSRAIRSEDAPTDMEAHRG